MSIEQTIEMMKAQVEQVGLPRFYKEDVDVDFKILKKYKNVQYVWMLRDCGSLLFPLRKGASPFHLEFYIRNDSTCRFFIVDGLSCNSFKEIKAAEVTKLINQEPFDFGLLTSSDDLIAKVGNLLTDVNVTASVFENPEYGKEPLYWQSWLTWFTGKNDMMEKVMRRAIKLLPQLHDKQSYAGMNIS
ncbi:TPA: hypothetical protein ACGSTL_001352 [Vibrio parahaemolyticus]|uniref:hypothetical protein n=1 Tax=Vibrio campbellii TaxID=680 RepID=UPI001F0742AB|nr:hypothetical protein [Vibrio campbellii]UMM06797.1 hypothetical protein MKR81_26415 [Vibrio campbellii]